MDVMELTITHRSTRALCRWKRRGGRRKRRRRKRRRRKKRKMEVNSKQKQESVWKVSKTRRGKKRRKGKENNA